MSSGTYAYAATVAMVSKLNSLLSNLEIVKYSSNERMNHLMMLIVM
jgi:hypothetical protein